MLFGEDLPNNQSIDSIAKTLQIIVLYYGYTDGHYFALYKDKQTKHIHNWDSSIRDTKKSGETIGSRPAKQGLRIAFQS